MWVGGREVGLHPKSSLRGMQWEDDGGRGTEGEG